jgi:hypothetical protein
MSSLGGTTIINNGYMGISVIMGDNYGYISGISFTGTPAPGASVNGVVYNNGTNNAFQAGVWVR